MFGNGGPSKSLLVLGGKNPFSETRFETAACAAARSCFPGSTYGSFSPRRFTSRSIAVPDSGWGKGIPCVIWTPFQRSGRSVVEQNVEGRMSESRESRREVAFLRSRGVAT
jgi:hypothetical protein